MSFNNTIMDKLRTFFGFRQEPPKNDFRNPIWGTDDDDDGDELYTRHQIMPFDPNDIHREFSRQVNEMIKSFGNIFVDMGSLFQDEQFDNYAGFADIPSESDKFDSNNIRNYYLNRNQNEQRDIDLDGQISSNEISGLLKKKHEENNMGTLIPFNGDTLTPFNGDMIPGRSFCKTVITTSITKPDGSVETRRIIKNGNEVVEETITTTTGPMESRPVNPVSDPIATPGIIYSHVLSELSSLFRNFY